MKPFVPHRVFTFLAATALACAAGAADKVRTGTVDLSLKLEVQSAIDRGLDALAKGQNEAGWWTRADLPAVSALALSAFQGDASKRFNNDSPVLKRGYAWLVGNAKPDGGIYVTNYPNYNTSISMMALLAAHDPKYDGILRKARAYLIGLQGDFGDRGKLDDPFDGGVGYGSHGPHSDMSNTLMALEAIYYSKDLDKDRPGAKDLDWDAVLHFIQNCQNLPAYNKQSWVTDDPANKGGFVYSPVESKAGEIKVDGDRTALRSYGSMSYAGLLSYIYADLKPSDPRVHAVLEWLGSNYTLEENPGMGQQGLFYYFHTMSKALTASKTDALMVSGDKSVNWRKELALRLINLQSADGSWHNETNRWMEKDPNLVTSYAVIALEMIHRGL